MASRATVVIPVRDGAALLRDCLASVIPQADALAVPVIVVDDGSIDRTAEVATAHGAHVIRLESSGGPYSARNIGWRAAGAPEVVVFTDARSRADPGWLDELLAAFDEPAVALAGGPVRIPSGGTVAQRAAHLQQPLDPGGTAAFLPWFAGANLAVRRTALEEAAGFDPSRGGGDVDLCWRVQLAGGKALHVARASMWSEPRRTVRELIAQHHRYGMNAARLDRRYAVVESGHRRPEPLRATVIAEGRQALVQWRSGHRNLRVVSAATLARIAYRRGYAFEVGA